MLSLLGIVLGVVFCIGFCMVPNWWRFAFASAVAALSFTALWFFTQPDWTCEVDLAAAAPSMCDQSVLVWRTFRWLVIGLPGLLVGVFWVAALTRLLRQNEQRDT